MTDHSVAVEVPAGSSSHVSLSILALSATAHPPLHLPFCLGSISASMGEHELLKGHCMLALLCACLSLHTHAPVSLQQGFASTEVLKEANIRGNPGYPRTDLFLWVSSVLLEDKLPTHDLFL